MSDFPDNSYRRYPNSEQEIYQYDLQRLFKRSCNSICPVSNIFCAHLNKVKYIDSNIKGILLRLGKARGAHSLRSPNHRPDHLTRSRYSHSHMGTKSANSKQKCLTRKIVKYMSRTQS